MIHYVGQICHHINAPQDHFEIIEILSSREEDATYFVNVNWINGKWTTTTGVNPKWFIPLDPPNRAPQESEDTSVFVELNRMNQA